MKMTDLMSGYFEKKDRGLLSEAKVSTSSLPVKATKAVDWKVKDNPPRFVKKFKFKSHEKYLNFIIGVLQYEASVKHNAKITLGYPEIIFEVWTHSLEQITDMDKEYCREVDHIIAEL
jgi:pterin-4a-carbinolamine dehydratase